MRGFRSGGGRRPARFGAGLLAAVALAGCELQEVAIADPQVDVLVAEALVQLGLPADGGGSLEHGRLSVFLHRTVQGPLGLNEPESGARVEVIRSDGTVYHLPEIFDHTGCVASTPRNGTGSCYLLTDEDLSPLPSLAPGDSLELRIETEGGELLRARTTIPGEFTFRGVSNETLCTLPPMTPYPLAWARSEGAQAYVSETQIYGLRAALEPQGIPVRYDPLFLSGLSISTADTAIVFPSQFGVFERFALDRDLAITLQQGLPPSTWAEIVVSAVDRNYANWIRGGNFNPSGAIRIPSVEGDGTGYFGASVSRWLNVFVNPPPGGGAYVVPPCPPSAATGEVVIPAPP